MGLLTRLLCGLTIALLGCNVAIADLYSASEAYKAKDYQKAFADFKELAELGHPASQFIVGLMYFNGEGVNRNRLVGYGWARLAADAGHEEAIKTEPKMRAEIDEENVERARDLLKKFAPDALTNRIYPKVIDNCEFQEKIVSPKIDKKRMKKLSIPDSPQMGESFIAVELSVAEDGTIRDARVLYALPEGKLEKEILKHSYKLFFEPATLDGKPIATTMVITFSHTNGGEQASRQLDAVVKKTLKKAEQGGVSSQHVYGLILAGLRKYNKPWSESLPWFMKAAQGGLAASQYMVGRSLLRGQGCEKDLVKAREWLILAARQDYSDAQIELARMSLKAGPYYEPDKAVFWLESAAKNGSTQAKKYLATLLAASTMEKLRDPKRALALSDEVLSIERQDVVSLEAKAAALAELNDFDQAVASEATALKLAKKMGWNTADLETRLTAYNTKQTWHGELLVF